MWHKIGVCLLLTAAVGLTACSGEVFEDNQVYVVEQGGKLEEDTVVGWLDIDSKAPFQTENSYQQKLTAEQIFLTASADGQLIFYEELAQEQDVAVLKGPGRVLVNLYAADQTTQTVQLIAANRPFITRTGWNPNGKMVAFCGENMLTIYDMEKKKTLLEEDLGSEAVSAFFGRRWKAANCIWNNRIILLAYFIIWSPRKRLNYMKRQNAFIIKPGWTIRIFMELVGVWTKKITKPSIP